MGADNGDQRSPTSPPSIVLRSSEGRWLILATMLGSGMAFLDGSVVTVALPAISREVGGGFSTQQWVLDAYLLTLSALLLLGGGLGDRYGRRRVFSLGLLVFTAASLACGLAPTGTALIVARLLQGVGAALLVPGSLALINSSVRREDRGTAVGTWAGLTGVASAVGPFFGGWLVDAASWRWVFFLNLPIAAVALIVTTRSVPESWSRTSPGPPDLAGASAVTFGLGGAVYALIEAPILGWTVSTGVAAVVGAVGLVLFPLIESRRSAPLLPLSLFRSVQFSGTNLTTFTVYAALSGALFLLSLRLQQSLGYSALAAGLATLPITVIMLLLSRSMGTFAQRTGPRIPMTLGPFICAVGLGLMTMIVPGSDYLWHVLPGVLVFGLGLSITVAPLTATVLASVTEHHAGLASGVNNAVSRVAGLLAVALLPLLAGVTRGSGAGLGPGFARAMVISAILCGLGGILAWCTVNRAAKVRRFTLPAVNHACQDPSARQDAMDSGGHG